MNASRFGVTVWPGALGDPDVMRPAWPEARLGSEGWIHLGSPTDEPAPVPPEMYLRLARDTDLTDAGALLEVVRAVGGFDLHSREQDFSGDYRAGWVRVGAARGLVGGPLSEVPPWSIHVAEVAYTLRVLAALGDVAVAYSQGDYVAPAWLAALEASDHRDWLRSIHPRAAREAAVWREWSSHLSHALRPWHVRPIISGLPGGPIGQPIPTLMQAGALQLVNDLAVQAEYSVCANEPCGRVFARQVDGMEVQTKRAGVRFCSRSCKNAQGQREYRRRQTAQRRKP